MRRALMILVALDAALLGFAACNNSYSTTSSAGDAGDDAGVDATVANDSAPTDANAPTDAGLCVGFDGSAQPTSGNVSCGAAGLKDLDSDPQNCGACGHSCFTAACDGTGHCVPESLVADPTESTTMLALDDASVYYSTATPGVVFKSSRTTPIAADAATIVASVSDAEAVAPNLLGVTSDGQNVFATTFSNLEVAPENATGGTFAPIAALPNFATTLHIVADDLRVAFTDTIAFHVRLKDGGVVDDYANLAGTADLAVTPDHQSFFFVARTNADAGMTTGPDGGQVTSGFLYRWRSDGSGLTAMTQFNTPTNASVGSRSVITADNAYVYFADGTDGSILALGINAPSGTVPTVVSQGHGRYINELYVDDERIYFTASTMLTNVYGIVSVSKCGGVETALVPETFSTAAYLPSGLLTDAQYLYWGSGYGIFRAAK